MDFLAVKFLELIFWDLWDLCLGNRGALLGLWRRIDER